MAGASGEHHWRNIIVPWLVLSVVVDPLFWFLVGPHMPPGNMTTSSTGASFDANVLSVMAIPVVLAIWVYLVYAAINWHHHKGDPITDGPPLRGHAGVQLAWLAVSSAIVMAVFGFGTYQLVAPAGAGGGEGQAPIWKISANHVLQVQVIGQQWRWTYRYPSYGGFETTDLILPVDTPIEFHVTSLDVIHDFWAYQLGVKADANPDSDNIAYTEALKTGGFVVRCDELCGIWHGAMFDYGKVVPKTGFAAWATATEKRMAPLTRTLPTYSLTYTPSANPAAFGAAEGNRYPYGPGQDQFSKEEAAPYKGKVR
jgi:cytochrome c oxidase subunit 2